MEDFLQGLEILVNSAERGNSLSEYTLYAGSTLDSSVLTILYKLCLGKAEGVSESCVAYDIFAFCVLRTQHTHGSKCKHCHVSIAYLAGKCAERLGFCKSHVASVPGLTIVPSALSFTDTRPQGGG